MLKSLKTICGSQLESSLALLSRSSSGCGSEEMMKHADLAERNKPVLRQFDDYGRRIDVIEFHPSYHRLMDFGITSGAGGFGYKNMGKEKYSHVLRCAMMYLENQLEPGHCCPIVMTSAAILEHLKEQG